MQAPDANGYVSIHWPSKNIPHGGIFHTRTSEPSAENQQFLKVLLEESKFNLKLRQNRCYGLRCEDEQPLRRQASAAPAPLVRPRTSRRRSLSAIRSSGILDDDGFCPLKRGVDREQLKDRLANTMAYGDSDQQQQPIPPRRVKPAPKLPTTKEKWNDLVTQIRERADWLAEMEYLGAAEPHRDVVQSQIAERMRALAALGVDSVPTTARSLASIASNKSAKASPPPRGSARTNASIDHSVTSLKSGSVRKSPHVGYKKDTSSGDPKKLAEENVSAYGRYQHSPLRYSPRRRV